MIVERTSTLINPDSEFSRYNIAINRIHACTERLADVSNDRFGDLVDLQLLADLVDDLEWPAVRVACVEVFQSRESHPWQPTLTIPDDWADGYHALAIETGFTVDDVDQAAAAVHAIVDRIDRANND